MANLKFARGSTIPTVGTTGFDDGCIYFNTSYSNIYLRNGAFVAEFKGTDGNVAVYNDSDTAESIFYLGGTPEIGSTGPLYTSSKTYIEDGRLYSGDSRCATHSDVCGTGDNVSAEAVALGTKQIYVIVCRDTNSNTTHTRNTGTSICSVYHNSLQVSNMMGYDGVTNAYGSATMIRNSAGDMVIGIPKLSFSTPPNGNYRLNNITWRDIEGNLINPYGDASTFVYLLSPQTQSYSGTII